MSEYKLLSVLNASESVRSEDMMLMKCLIPQNYVKLLEA